MESILLSKGRSSIPLDLNRDNAVDRLCLGKLEASLSPEIRM